MKTVAKRIIGVTAIIAGLLLVGCGAETATPAPEPGGPSRQQAQLTASDAGLGRILGGSVAMSADGTICIVGTDIGTILANAVVLFGRSGDAWSELQTLTPTPAENVYGFGRAIAMSGDGNIVLVGAYRGAHADAVAPPYVSGEVYVFMRNGPTWTQQQILRVAEATPEYFGGRLAISRDGTTAVIAAAAANEKEGAAYIFTREGGTWSQRQRLKASDAERGDAFGDNVALSSDGSVVIVGANAEYGAKTSGAAYFFVKYDAHWSQQQMLTVNDPQTTLQGFGRSISVSDDGNTALIGAFQARKYADPRAGETSIAYLAIRTGTQWTMQTLEVSGGTAGDFGRRVALSGDGNTAVIAAPGFSTNTGAAYLFTRTATGWSKARKLTPTGAKYDPFGAAVALNTDGTTLIVGAKDSLETPGYGCAFVFV